MIRPGRLNRTITVLRGSDELDIYGAPTPQWEPVAKLRAELVEQSAYEVQDDIGALSKRTVQLRTRWAAITLADRLVFDGTEFNVVSLTEIGRRRGLEIKCVARGAA